MPTPRHATARPWVGASRSAALAFAAALGGYLLLAGSLTWTEAAAALAVAGAVAGFVAMQTLRQDRPVAAPLPPPRALGAALASLAADTVRVGAALARAVAGRPGDGEARWQAFDPGADSAGDAGRRALVTVLTSLAPNGFVLDIAPSSLPEAGHAMLLHRLAPAPPLSGRYWPA